jgi:hypothetical protein
MQFPILQAILQQDHARAASDGAGLHDAFHQAARQSCALWIQLREQTVGEQRQPFHEPGDTAGFDDVFFGDPGAAYRDVVHHGAGEDILVAEAIADHGTHMFQVQAVHGMAIHLQAACGGRDTPTEDAQQGGLARSVRAAQAHLFARCQVQVDPGEHRAFVPFGGEAQVDGAHVEPFVRILGERCKSTGPFQLDIGDLSDLLQRGEHIVHRSDVEDDLLHGVDHQQDHDLGGHELAQVHLFVDHEQTAQCKQAKVTMTLKTTMAEY